MNKHIWLCAGYAVACLLSVGCSKADSAVTQLLVQVDAEPGLAVQLEQLDVLLYAVGSDGSSVGEPLRTQHFALTQSEPAQGKVHVPFSFGIAKGIADEVQLVFRGFGSGTQDAAPIVEHKLVARFQAGLTRQVDVFLTLGAAPVANAAAGSRAGSAAGGAGAGAERDAGQHLDASTTMDAARDASSDAQVPETKPTTRPSTIPAQDAGSDDAGPELGACAGNNACTWPDYPCAATMGGGYVCLGRFADWSMPDPAGPSKTAASYDFTSSAGIVMDRVTGLQWQRALPSAYPGCSGKEKTQGDTCSWAQAKNYCAQLTLDGMGWRLPSKIEQESIVGDTANVPTVDFAAFPDVSVTQIYWTSSSMADIDGVAWAVRLGLALTLPEDVTITHYVRCVRGTPHTTGVPRDHYKVNEQQDTVTDTRTQLVWQRHYGDTDTLDAANQYCRDAGAGWRLPGLKELLTLVDPTRSEPAIAPEFPALPLGGIFYSATPMATGNGQQMAVDFSAGMSSGDQMFRNIQATVRVTFHARCVR